MWKEILKAPPSWDVDISDLPSKTRIALSENKKISPKKYIQTSRHMKFKPNGLWYSFSSQYNWIDYLKDASPEWDKNYNHMITFDITGKIFTFNTNDDYFEFIRKYGRIRNENLEMKWDEVAQDYDVLEFNKLPSRFAMDSKFGKYRVYWTDALDVSSGVVLNTSAVKNQKLIASRTDKSKTVPLRGYDDETYELYDWKKHTT